MIEPVSPVVEQAQPALADDPAVSPPLHGPEMNALRRIRAHNTTFGYREVNLRDWVAARTAMPPEKITSIPLDALDTPAPAEEILLSLREGDIVVANVAAAADLEMLVLACQAAERAVRCSRRHDKGGGRP